MQGSEEWRKVGDQFSTLTERLREHYKLAGAEGDVTGSAQDHSGAAEEEVKNAMRTLGDAFDRVFTSVGNAMRDSEVRAEAKEAAGSAITALGTTLSDLAGELRQIIGRTTERPDDAASGGDTADATVSDGDWAPTSDTASDATASEGTAIDGPPSDGPAEDGVTSGKDAEGETDPGVTWDNMAPDEESSGQQASGIELPDTTPEPAPTTFPPDPAPTTLPPDQPPTTTPPDPAPTTVPPEQPPTSTPPDETPTTIPPDESPAEEPATEMPPVTPPEEDLPR